MEATFKEDLVGLGVHSLALVIILKKFELKKGSPPVPPVRNINRTQLMVLTRN